MARFDGRSLLVTGGTRGIGRAIVLGALAEGGQVVFCARPGSRRGADEVVRLAGAEGRQRLHFLPADVTAEDDVDRLFAGARSRLGRLDVVVSNAGATRDGLLVRTSLATWREMLAVNLRSHFLVLQRAARELAADGGGSIVTVSSIAANGLVGQGAYAAAKAGVLALTRCAAREYEPEGIRCNAVVPSYVETDMVAGFDETSRRQRERLSPHGRFGRPEEVAEAVLFLASAEAAGVNGEALYVSGAIWEDWSPAADAAARPRPAQVTRTG